MARACALKPTILRRIWRGYYERRSEDLTLVPLAPNYPGAFDLAGHAGPWRYLQRVPLVLYGPGRIAAAGTPLRRHASITDVYPTIGRLVRVPLQRRVGSVLAEALEPHLHGRPRLVVTVVWDGVGRNVLERWPGSWPTLERLEAAGTSYLNATVGSSPSITPATHSSLGTGTFPNKHGMTAITYRTDSGEVKETFAGKDPSDLERTTFADDIDLAFGNQSRVGLLAWRTWHLGMLGHGAQLRGGDKDELALIRDEGGVAGNDAYYATPTYLQGVGAPTRYAEELDRKDGELDGRWMGHEILDMHDNPAWVRYQSDMLIEMLRRGGYGTDPIPDLLFTNFKVSDIVGHQFTIDSQEMQAVLQEQDRALHDLVRYLEREVGDYVLVVTADHGHVPSWSRTHAWPVGIGEVRADIDARFRVPRGRSLSIDSGSTGLFLDHRLMRELTVTGEDIARFLNGYTIAENWTGASLPQGYEERGDEPVLAAAIPGSLRSEIARCAFGAASPPSHARN